MNLLLDTHALLWWLADDPRLSEKARKLISNPKNKVLISAVSAWEISIKKTLGKLDVDLDRLHSEVESNGFTLLNCNFHHGLTAGSLPRHHGDPFDRMLIAQAQCESLKLISVDEKFDAYDVELVW